MRIQALDVLKEFSDFFEMYEDQQYIFCKFVSKELIIFIKPETEKKFRESCFSSNRRRAIPAHLKLNYYMNRKDHFKETVEVKHML